MLKDAYDIWSAEDYKCLYCFDERDKLVPMTKFIYRHERWKLK